MPLLFAGARLRAPLVVVVATAVFLSLGSASASAAKGGKPGGGSGGSASLSLVRDYVSNSPNPAAPPWCMNEDDLHERTWSGALSGEFTVTEPLCDRSVDYSGGQYWSAGGTGVNAEVWAVGTLNDLTISSPQGDVHHAVLMDSTTSKGVVTNHYSVCFVPTYEATYDTGGAPLPGGPWTIQLTGSVSKVNYHVTATMTDVTYQQIYCPPSQQNIFYP